MDTQTLTRETEAPALAPALARLIGPENVLTDPETLALYSQDVFEATNPAAIVIRPGTAAELGQAVRAATEAGYAVVPRGGGMSYTGGYLPRRQDSVIVDMGRMNRVLHVSTEDLYVTVEAGCTWHTLHQALAGTGLRTPMWGTLSGLRATVGGGLSQNSLFFGSASAGITADMVLSLDVVLADGSLLKTGAAAAGTKPFFRWFGPDLTGLFCGDTGALGIKAAATLKLVPVAGADRHASFAFDTSPPLYRAMAAVAKAGLATEVAAFDPGLQGQRLKRQSLADDLNRLKGVVQSQSGFFTGLMEAAKVAKAGRRFMDDVKWSVHFTVEGRDGAAADRALDELRRICVEGHGGREIENTIPKVMRATPFTELTSMLGPGGERWVPVHGIVPHSEAIAAQADLDALWAETAADCERLDIQVGHLATLAGATGFLIEPVFFWPGPPLPLHVRTLGADYVGKLNSQPFSAEADQLVRRMREQAAEILGRRGVHFQIGKAYRYRDRLSEPAGRLLEAIKDAVDPKRLINPGSLGLS